MTFALRSDQTITHRDPRIDPLWKNKIELYRPSVIFLGNSMLGEGIDTNLFQKKTNIRAMKIYRGGAASAWWYTVFKNSIVEAEHKPKQVVIFFRDQFLTQPDYRVNGKFKARIDRFAGASEPILDRLAYYNSMDKTTFILHQNWSLYRNHEKIKENITQQIKGVAAKTFFDLSLETIDQKINESFSEKELNKKLFTKQQLQAEKEKKIGTSRRGSNYFLPTPT